MAILYPYQKTFMDFSVGVRPGALGEKKKGTEILVRILCGKPVPGCTMYFFICTMYLQKIQCTRTKYVVLLTLQTKGLNNFRRCISQVKTKSGQLLYSFST